MEQQQAVVIGAGAIGIVLADALATAGLGVVVLGGRPIDRVVLLDGEQTREHPVTHLPAWDGRTHRGPVVVAVKAHHTAAIGPLLAAVAPTASAVVVAQNGIEQRARVAPFIGVTPVVPLLAYTPAERLEPGRAVLRRPADRELVLPGDGPSQEVARLLREGGLRVETSAAFETEAWRKLLTNLASMSVTTLTGRQLEVIRDPEVAAFAVALVAEAVQAAGAEGAAIGPDEPGRFVEWLQRLPEGSTTSMLQDRQAGRPLEWDAIHGAALRAANRHAIPVLLLRSVTALLAAMRP